MEALPKTKDSFYRGCLLVTIEDGKKTCYGQYIPYSQTMVRDIVIIEESFVENLVLDLLDYEGDYEGIKKTRLDLVNLLPDDSDIKKKIKKLVVTIEENKKFFSGLKMVYEDKYTQVYEKKTPEEISYIYTNYVKTCTTNTWCYHYNDKMHSSISSSIGYIEGKPDPFTKSDYVNPILGALLNNIISDCSIIREKFKEEQKNGIRGYPNREVDYVDIKRFLEKYKY